MAVAERGSFVAASEALGLSSSGVGKAVARLESRLNVRLFQRTTRKVQLTPEGLAFRTRCHGLLESLSEAEQSLEKVRGEPEGLLRIDMPVAYGRIVVMPIVAAFKAAQPKVNFDLLFSDRLSDVIDNRLDVVFRLGELRDSSLVARPFDRIQYGAYAAKPYLRKLGRIVRPNDLERAERLCFTLVNGRPFDFRFERGKEVVRLSPGAGLISNDIEGVIEAAELGMGVAFIPSFLATWPQTRKLTKILRGWASPGPPVHMLYPSSRHLSSRVRAFVDFAQARSPTAR